MTSKERIRAALSRQVPDRVPATMHCVNEIWEALCKHFNVESADEVQEILKIDTRFMLLPPCKTSLPAPYVNENGETVYTHPLGYRYVKKWNSVEYNDHIIYFPLEHIETWEDWENYEGWYSPDDFDYDAVRDFCDRHHDKAIRIGWPGPYQVFTHLYPAQKFYVLMLEEPELVQAMLKKYCDIHLEIYHRMFIASGDRIDILCCCDDYGTQQGLLFGPETWERFFAENTRRFVDLAHEHNCFYMQHSCGAIRPIIPKLISCGVDAIEPIQKVIGMDVDELKAEYGEQISFQGGVDTQRILPYGTPEEVSAETERIIRALSPGYILAPSQKFEGDVPLKNILAFYETRKVFGDVR